MISSATIKKYGLDPDSLKALFTADKPKPKVKALTDLLADRIKEWRERNFSDYKLWAAVDFAFDTPLEQTTPTMLRHIMATCKTEKDMLTALRGWGLSEDCLFTQEVKGGQTIWHLNPKAFTEVFVPLVRAYLTIRLSKIFNDRNRTPLFDFKPLWPTAENRLLCEIYEAVVETVATNFGYPAVLRDFIMHALMYSVSLKFPVEPWTEYIQEDEDGDEVVEKEGINYVIPHISRIGYDLNFPVHTLNTGTGCTYGLYWTVIRWGDIDTDIFWNTDKIPHGTNWLDPSSSYHNYFTEVYPCTLNFPTPRKKKTDREDVAVGGCYGKNDYDAAFFATYVFMELVPAEWGLGKYKHKVWMKFTIGSDRTVMYAETFTYRPIDYIGYDADSGRGRNASLALEVLPFQDLAGNALTQYLLVVKRNLANITFYNNQVVNPEQISDLNKQSNKQYSQMNFVGYNPLEMERAGNNMGEVFKTVTFPFTDPTQVLQSLNTIISVLERLLVVSAQESGASASHQQSKKEVELTNSNTSNRVAYTASFVDEGIDAWKRQLIEACLMNMSAKEVMASISTDIPNLAENLKKLGFSFVDGDPKLGEKKVMVTGKLTVLKPVQLISRRSDADRDNDQSTAQAMFTAISTISNSQMLSQIVDPASLAEMLEVATKLAGADNDFKIKVNTDSAIGNQLQKVIEQIKQQLMAGIEKEVVQPMTQAIADDSKKTQENSSAIEQIVANLEQIQQAIKAAQQPPPPPAPLAPPPAPLTPALNALPLGAPPNATNP